MYWAMYGLREEDCEYRITSEAKSIYEIIWHVLGLVNWVYMNVYGEPMHRPENILEQGVETLKALEKMRSTFLQVSDEDIQNYKLGERSFWNYINMPLSDALHHVGQISILRRGAGNPNQVGKHL